MRIQVHRTGGFAGIERYAEVDTSERPDAAHWEALATRALAPHREDEPSAVVPDGFSYEITVDGRSVSCRDPHLTHEQRELIRMVLKEGA
ncbi:MULTISPECIES: protealysin inhibitor emfourin [Streptomyces]|uniref:Protealysin inhibitor emfourin n=1 Tax=Streptomyces solicathayae TaxID=3081768 RepID=A0ABZ0LY68_9ACTN|nr:protealysin inhibitor emfourin [Streptomyces sp. HUAS YS2]WOX24460.1 protealysin inhibitor emfourin [Streptomyces sp. HUAS YS2]